MRTITTTKMVTKYLRLVKHKNEPNTKWNIAGQSFGESCVVIMESIEADRGTRTACPNYDFTYAPIQVEVTEEMVVPETTIHYVETRYTRLYRVKGSCNPWHSEENADGKPVVTETNTSQPAHTYEYAYVPFPYIRTAVEHISPDSKRINMPDVLKDWHFATNFKASDVNAYIEALNKSNTTGLICERGADCNNTVVTGYFSLWVSEKDWKQPNGLSHFWNVYDKVKKG